MDSFLPHVQTGSGYEMIATHLQKVARKTQKNTNMKAPRAYNGKYTFSNPKSPRRLLFSKFNGISAKIKQINKVPLKIMFENSVNYEL